MPLTRDELIAQLIQFRARYPQQGHRFVQLLDMDHDTGVTHRVSPDELLAGRQCGDYEAFCGVRFPVASMVEPGRGRCAECVTP